MSWSWLKTLNVLNMAVITFTLIINCDAAGILLIYVTYFFTSIPGTYVLQRYLQTLNTS